METGDSEQDQLVREVMRAKFCCRHWFSWCVLLLLFFLVPQPVWSALQDNAMTVEGEKPGLVQLADFMIGQPAEDTIYLGMWSHHFIDDDDAYHTTHNLLGITYSGFFGGTFLNSLGERSWSLVSSAICTVPRLALYLWEWVIGWGCFMDTITCNYMTRACFRSFNCMQIFTTRGLACNYPGLEMPVLPGFYFVSRDKPMRRKGYGYCR